jgi:hypothetical protein
MELAFSTSFLTNILRWYWNWMIMLLTEEKEKLNSVIVLYCDEFLGCDKRQ